MRIGLALSLWVAGCGQGGEHDAPLAEPPPPANETEVAHAAPAPPDPPPARLLDLTGPVTLAGAAAVPNVEVELEQPVEVPAQGRGSLQLHDGGRVAMDGPALARVVDDGAPEVYLLRGSAHVMQPPTGNQTRAPLRISTPTISAEIGVAGELYVAVFPGGSTWLTVLSGLVTVSDGEADARQQLRSLDLLTQQAVVTTGRIGDTTEGPARLDAARAMGNALGAEVPPTDVARMRRELGVQTERLDQALRWLEAETRRGRELTTQHHNAVRDGAQDEVNRLLRELVELSRSLYRLRRLATTRWERVRTQLLLLSSMGETVTPDPVATRRDRIAGLLGS